MHPTLPLSILLLSIPLIGANPIPNPDLPAMQDLPPMRISAKIPDVNNQGSPEAVAAAMADPSFAADPQGVDSAALDAQVKAGGGDTQNGLSGPCKAMTVIFARGTTETGNVGTLAGPAFFDKLNAIMGPANVAVQGVPYPADIPGFLIGGDPQGSVTMAQMVKQAMTACPKTAVVMAGYSQGGQLVHNAADMLSAAESAKVSSAVIFGDPDKGEAVGAIPAAKTKVICHATDNICMGGAVILASHLTYSANAGEAASFAAAAAT